MEPESEKMNQAAQPVAEQKPENAEPIKEPSINDVLAGVDPKQLALAEKMGIPLSKLLTYMQYQEQKLNFIAANAIDKAQLKDGLNEWVGELRKQANAQIQKAGPVPQQATGSLASALQMLSSMGLMGGAADDPLKDLAMKALNAQINMSQAISNAVISKIMGKATTEVAEAVTS